MFLILCTCLLEGGNQQFADETKDSWISEESVGTLSEEFPQNSTGEERKYVCPKRNAQHPQKIPPASGAATWSSLRGLTLLAIDETRSRFRPTLNLNLPANSAKSHNNNDNNNVSCSPSSENKKMKKKRQNTPLTFKKLLSNPLLNQTAQFPFE